jgi:hypothetical protein
MNKGRNAILETLHTIARQQGVKVLEKTNGQFQLKGPHLTVEYYPWSNNQRAYITGTTSSKNNVNVVEAVGMAVERPPKATAMLKDTRPKNTRKIRLRLLKGKPTCKCHWCPTIIDLDSSTLEHIIPLDRGGLDNDNNRTLACKPCNNRRGSDMPEIVAPAKKRPVLQSIAQLRDSIIKIEEELLELKVLLVSNDILTEEAVTKDGKIALLKDRLKITQRLGSKKVALRKLNLQMSEVESASFFKGFQKAARELLPSEIYQQLVTKAKEHQPQQEVL